MPVSSLDKECFFGSEWPEHPIDNTLFSGFKKEKNKSDTTLTKCRQNKYNYKKTMIYFKMT